MGEHPPDTVRAADDADKALPALKRATTVTVWDLPMDFNVLQALAAKPEVDVDVPPNPDRPTLEQALAEYFTENDE